jgi:hypothetical protein
MEGAFSRPAAFHLVDVFFITQCRKKRPPSLALVIDTLCSNHPSH